MHPSPTATPPGWSYAQNLTQPQLGPPRRHPWEIPLLVLAIVIMAVVYLTALVLIAVGTAPVWVLVVLAAPIIVYLGRGQGYAMPRVAGVKVSPTQFPEAHAMVVAAAQHFRMAKVPDAYVVLGNGQINAYSSGHGFRRYVVVYSDLFEIGGQARNPVALQFIIGHEVGHIAAGHTSYWRQLGMFASNFVPVVGPALSRAQEYTADNHGFYVRPDGREGAIGVMSAGKYLLGLVDFHQMADRAVTETGFFTWLANLLAGHPVNTWRAHALRDRSRAGRMFFRPRP
ncbi:M48 family metallopeptidase [Rhodococcus sp. D2-41]|uniref:M48 family metallopeptidase n=1 Tax=Speluncibacter jeojiensis TaxID=2710754 RepID=A0A9X4LVT6_9ACTN|nr:M48 family metallopeptidase [Rhodococcus sp. D2-41]MDG3013209.1 M48 family metallopeptidase [Corynebacteriales bacterium D3-21]